MNKILILIPDKLPQKLIMRGFCRGFKANKYYVESQFEKELSIDFVEKLHPKIIFSYGNFSTKSKILKSYYKKNKEVKNIVYFADGKICKEKFPPHTKIFASDRFINKKFIYLPLAVSPRTYNSEFDDNYEHVISFVGNPNSKKRIQILAEVVKAFGHNLSVFCEKKQFEKSVAKIKNYLSDNELVTYKYCYQGFLEDERAISKVLNTSKINLNIITKFDTSLNFHAFETLAAGGFLLTNNILASYEFFDLGRDLETYKDTDELLDKIRFYITQTDISQTIALNGKDAVRKTHAFKDRAKTILKILEKY